jgi:glycosyltransferase involved in cell wall biosynthesis
MKNCEIKVSVVMPIYNAYSYLEPAIDSVLNQTLREIELICVDDGSTDKSLKKIKEYQERDDRVRIVTETNAGPALARNKGISKARGEYLAFLDADDFFEPTMLEEMYNAAKKDELDIVISEYDVYNDKSAKFESAPKNEHEEIYIKGVVTSKNEHPEEILLSTIGNAWNKLFKRSFINEKELIFLPDVKLYEDAYFVICALSLAERVGKVFDVLMHHRVYSSQVRAKAFKKYYSHIPIVYTAVREFLRAHGMLAPLQDGYLNLTSSRCYKTYNALGKDEKEEFWNILHDKYSELMGWRDYSREDFEIEEICEFVACVELYNHDEYRSAVANRRKPRLDRLKQILKAAKARKKIRDFFSRHFGKKKDKKKKIQEMGQGT